MHKAASVRVKAWEDASGRSNTLERGKGTHLRRHIRSVKGLNTLPITWMGEETANKPETTRRNHWQVVSTRRIRGGA